MPVMDVGINETLEPFAVREVGKSVAGYNESKQELCG